MIKKLMSYIGEFKRDTILSPVFVTVEVFLEVLLPTLMALVIDNGVETGDMNYVMKMGLIMLVVAMLSLAAGTLSGVFAAKASMGFGRNLRRGMFDNIQDFAFRNIDHFSTAGLVTRMTTDVTNVQNAYQMLVRMFVRAPIMMISALIMCVKINARISLIFLAALVFLGLVLSFVIRRAFPLFNEMFRGYDSLNASVQENLTGIRVVKAYVREDHENDKFCKTTDRLKNLSVHAEKLVIMNQPVMQLTVYTCILLISWIGAKMIVVNGTMTTGELMSLFTYTMQILMSLMMMSMVFVMVTMASSSAKRITEVLDEKSTLHNPENPVYQVEDGSIEFDHVNFAYSENETKEEREEKCVLADINFQIHSGETIGIIGGTGSSKSTLVQLIPRLYDVLDGSVRVGGRDVREYDIETLRNEVSMVLQKNVLFSGTILDNLRWGNKEATEEECRHACELAQASEFIDKMPDGYETFIEQGGSNVSGGQKQRLCIARALLKKPKILILDDSTSAVDTKTDALIRKAFREEIPATTKIIIAQRISSIEDADRILVLDQGRISGMGTHEELLETNEIYRDIYRLQQKGAGLNE
ncbi:ABC transporter ATP-binding protein [Hominiventricola filiformis]|uniref:ABC transporter ATP-binding protein/permease n=1 Tax=Hominiventricola filiformis TaxID=2885352 RepID=A0AAE3DB64_9FIRM|nr:ABC transporter ATP-binding protein [Hominiventricola filiformis]MCC2125241.1 ABC transporter ATP-binding protein/permease [Hominiventricola filiformis]RHU83260.1 ABC transporter ATP-binding protein [Clostridiaceae bacterium OM08-6BH]